MQENVKPGRPIPASILRRFAERMRGVGGISAGAPLQLKDQRGGPALGNGESEPFKVKLTGTANPYSMTEVYGTAGGGYSVLTGGRSCTNCVYVENAITGLNNKIIKVAADAFDTYRGFFRRKGGAPPECDNNVCGCTARLPFTFTASDASLAADIPLDWNAGAGLWGTSGTILGADGQGVASVSHRYTHGAGTSCTDHGAGSVEVFFKLECPSVVGGTFRLTQSWFSCSKTSDGVQTRYIAFADRVNATDFCTETVTAKHCADGFPWGFTFSANAPVATVSLADGGGTAFKFKVTITVTGCGGPIPGATVTFDGNTKTTPANGIVYFPARATGTFNAVVSKTNFVTQTVPIPVVGCADVSRTIDLSPSSGYICCLCNDIPQATASPITVTDPVLGAVVCSWKPALNTWSAIKVATAVRCRNRLAGCPADLTGDVPVLYLVNCASLRIFVPSCDTFGSWLESGVTGDPNQLQTQFHFPQGFAVGAQSVCVPLNGSGTVNLGGTLFADIWGAGSHTWLFST
jgi:hypothetical protein